VIDETIPIALDGERIDRLVALITGVSRAAASDLVAAGVVQVNGVVAAARSVRVHEGDVVAIDYEHDDTPVVLAGDDQVPIEVVFDDDEVIVVDKPPGLIVHPGAGNDTGTLVQGLLARYPELADVGDPARPGIVHRIDRNTSGLLVVARTPRAYDALVAQLADRSVERRYEALAWGAFESPVGRIDGAIGRSKRHPTRMTVSTTGREARTDYRVLGTSVGPVVLSHLECRLHTGRTHQIRVHLTSIGRPVVGDDLYGGTRESFVTPRMFLHAETLGFDHPATGERLVLRAPLPPDLAEVMGRLEFPGD